MNPEWRSGGNWGRWGAEDERGTANLADPAKTLAALSIPTEGRVITLGHLLRTDGIPMLTQRARPVHTFFIDGGDYAAGTEPDGDAQVAEDHLALRIHGNTSHVDALGHVWQEDTIYNGFSANTIRSDGMRRCGIDKLGHLMTRGVLLDVAGHLGLPYLDGGEQIGPDLLEEVAAAAEVTIGPGDVVLLRTGWFDWARLHEHEYQERYPGITVETAQLLADRDVAGVGSDTPAVECRPYSGTGRIPAHRLLLHRYGVTLFELLDLDELAESGAGEHLFVAAPLRIMGGTGSPLNPLAVI